MSKSLAAILLSLPVLWPAQLSAQLFDDPGAAQPFRFEPDPARARASSGSRPEVLNRIVAVVNEDVVLQSELEQEMRTIVGELRAKGVALPPRDDLERQVLERLIVTRLQLQLAKQSGIEVDDETLNRAVASIARRNGLTLRELRDALEAEGFDYESFREQIREELTVRRVRQRQVNNQVTVTDEEVDAFLATQGVASDADTEFHLAHILVSVPQAASPDVVAEAKAKADALIAELRSGADFRATAIRVSDAEDALEGGDLGWRKAAQVPTGFLTILEQMRPGDITEPIRSASGFHIFMLKDVRAGSAMMVTQTHARHILIKTSEIVSDEDARLRLLRIKARVEGGDDFATLARSHSDDTTSAVKGGDLGWGSPGKFVNEFEEVMNALPVGGVSEPFRTPFGWHIVQVLDRRREDRTDEVMRAKAREQIMERKVEEETEQWLRQLRDEAYVEYRLETGNEGT